MYNPNEVVNARRTDPFITCAKNIETCKHVQFLFRLSCTVLVLYHAESSFRLAVGIVASTRCCQLKRVVNGINCNCKFTSFDLYSYYHPDLHLNLHLNLHLQR